jgi:hypothetical protein
MIIETELDIEEKISSAIKRPKIQILFPLTILSVITISATVM